MLIDTSAALLELDLLMCNGLLPCFCEGACCDGCGQRHKLMTQAYRKIGACRSDNYGFRV